MLGNSSDIQYKRARCTCIKIIYTYTPILGHVRCDIFFYTSEKKREWLEEEVVGVRGIA